MFKISSNTSIKKMSQGKNKILMNLYFIQDGEIAKNILNQRKRWWEESNSILELFMRTDTTRKTKTWGKYLKFCKESQWLKMKREKIITLSWSAIFSKIAKRNKIRRMKDGITTKQKIILLKILFVENISLPSLSTQ